MMNENQTNSGTKAKRKKEPYWLIYASLLISGMILIAVAFDLSFLNRWTAKFGIALVFSALALIIANGKKSGLIATGIIWAAVISAYII